MPGTTNGTNGNDFLTGTPGDDLLLGFDGNDTLWGGAGNDTLAGGNGVDIARYLEPHSHATISPGNGGYVIQTLAEGTDTLTGIERIGFSDGNLMLAPDGAVLGAMAILVALRGAEVLDHPGLLGRYIGYADRGLSLVELAALAISDLSGSLPWYDDFVDTVYANVFGGAPEAATRAHFVDLLKGGSFDESSLLALAAAQQVVASKVQQLLAAFPGGLPYIQATPSVALGGLGNDVLGSTQRNDALFGRAGDDTLVAGAGMDSIFGGAGDDVAVFAGAYADYTVSVSYARPDLVEVQGLGLHAFVAGVETLRFDDQDVDRQSLVQATVIAHLQYALQQSFREFRVLADPASTDLLLVGPGINVVLEDAQTLGFGDRSFAVHQGDDAGNVLDALDSAGLLRGRRGNDVLHGGNAADALYGDSEDDSLEGNGGDDFLDGGSGNDTLAGGFGNDTYLVDSTGDAVHEPDVISGDVPEGAAAQASLGAGIDRVVASIDYTLGASIEQLEQAGSADLSGTGNELDNLMIGNEGNDQLSGAGGNDTIDGGAGIDVATYSGARAGYTVTAGTAITVQALATGEGLDTLTGIERLQFSDAKLAFDLEGNAGIVAKVVGAVYGASSLGDRELVAIELSHADGGMSYEELAQEALQDVLGGTIASSKAVVDLLWANVIGGSPDAATEQYYMGFIDGGGYTAATLVMLAADTSYNLANIGFTGLQEHGIVYAS